MILIVIINFDLTETILIQKVVQKRPPKAAQIVNKMWVSI